MSAAYQSAQQVWLGVRVQLCRVHVIRAWERKFVEIFGKVFFYSDKNMMIFYKILQGIFFLPVTKFPIIIDFLRNEFRDLFPGKNQKFDRIFEYLTENYLNSEAKFKPSLWSSYNEISDFENFDNSTNFVESLNFVLKKFVPRGTVSFKKACETIFRFKIYERQRAGFLRVGSTRPWFPGFAPVSGLRIQKYGFRAGFRVPGPGENPEINYVFLH